ncbi:hypothetical protein [Piscinibacter gummiphilus]|uniref:Uncharacterized protein n=1 Tax=Piscinibacter gummiphilus TaxID=946333 RepID=A0A1W6LF51_9BURK|nr:hypothetical protein [Piscinibacter gummiphilus]ARN22860.1 hypothetical protein A4W93_24740 [Piscinibacter gummiphilus]ATU67557.1 hypothetical protein CPZ87_24870 [Piscinibacter gummiphilus]GLS96675.1 hypothetical protein GCM10007918_39670 [Piscinibacter gummiphilus]
MLKPLTVATVLALSACAAPMTYDTTLASWAGAPEEELVREWGAPLRTTEADGRRSIAFESRRIARERSRTGDREYVNVRLSCTTTFELENGRVVEWSHRGNDCRPRPSANRDGQRSVPISDEDTPGAPAIVRVGRTGHAAGCGLLTPDDLVELGVPGDLRNTHSIEKGDGALVCRFDPVSGKLPSVTLLFLRGNDRRINQFRTDVEEKARKPAPTRFVMPDGFCEAGASPVVAVVKVMGGTAATDHSIVTLTVLTSGQHTRPPQGAEPEQRVMQRLLDRVREGGA